MWDADQYEKFAEPRRQPGLDLLHRLPPVAPDRVIDLGCGAGALTPALRARFPDARLVGVDNDPAMLARAREAHGDAADWVEADIADWAPDGPVDMIFSNAALHWLPKHAALFPRLLQWFAPGGILAVQMPRNFSEPSHQILRNLAAEGPWADRLSIPARPVLDMTGYWDLLAPRTATLDLWETQYLHQLTGPDPVYEWTKGTALTPIRAALTEAEFEDFAARYKKRLLEAYPQWPGGTTLYPFRRLFMVASVGG